MAVKQTNGWLGFVQFFHVVAGVWGLHVLTPQTTANITADGVTFEGQQGGGTDTTTHDSNIEVALPLLNNTLTRVTLERTGIDTPTIPLDDSNLQPTTTLVAETNALPFNHTATSVVQHNPATDGITSLNDTLNNATPLTSAFSRLIATQLELCGYTALCTIRYPPNQSTPVGCCRECTCNPDCMTNNDCCVDYVMNLAIGADTEFRSLADLQIALANVTTKTGLENMLDQMYFNKGFEFVSKGMSVDQVECEQLQLSPVAGVSNPTQYYELVTGCKGSDRNSGDDCLKEVWTQADLLNIFPVTSLITGKTYKTKTVYDCCGENENDETFEYWDMFIECYMLSRRVDFFVSYVSHPLLLLNGQNLTPGCYVVFEPNAYITSRGFTPKECTVADIRTCSATQGTKEYEFLRSFCGSENLYVTLINEEASPTIYNNAACVLCNHGNHTVQTGCRKNRTSTLSDDVMKLRVNLDKVQHTSPTTWELYDDGYLNTQALSGFAVQSEGCSVGYIYLPTLKECMRLYCPKSKYTANGSCVPLYDLVTGTTFRTAFNMTIISKGRQNLKKLSLERALNRFLMTEHFNAANLTIDRVRMIPIGYTYMVEMALVSQNPSGITMSSVVEAVSRWHYVTVDVNVAGNNNVEMGISPGILAMFNRNQFKFNRARGLVIQEVKNSSFASQEYRYSMDISESNTCYRVALNRTFFVGLDKYVFSIPIINATIFRDNIDKTPSDELLACSDLFLNQSRYFRVKSDAVELNRIKPPPDDVQFIIFVVIISVVCISTLFVFGIRLLPKLSICTQT